MAFLRSFVRGTETLDTTTSLLESDSSSRHRRPHQERHISGEEAKSFYDQLVGLSSPEANQSQKRLNSWDDTKTQSEIKKDPDCQSSCTSTTRPRVDKSAVEPKTERQLRRLHSDYLRYAQDGDLAEMQRCKAAGDIPIDYADHYGWTAMMCAARAGHSNVVKWLLEEGADASLQNNQRETAAHLAKRRSVARLLSKHRKGLPLDSENCGNGGASEKFFCDVCQQEFSDTTPLVHQTSTVHLFNRQEKPQTTHYYIPPANKGFQLMIRGGWEPNKGLGVEGQGRKFPVKTVLKRDRQGLGGGEPVPAKVTHFNPNDTEAVAAPTEQPRTMRKATLSKKQRKRKLTKERAKERDFRLEFYTE